MKWTPKYLGLVVSAVFFVIGLVLVFVIEKPHESESFSSKGGIDDPIEIVDETVDGDNSPDPTQRPVNVETLTRFYAIGDVPYSSLEAEELLVQMQNIPVDAEFVIHVGDIRSAKDGRNCELAEFYEVASILNQSHVPVFVIFGGESARSIALCVTNSWWILSVLHFFSFL